MTPPARARSSRRWWPLALLLLGVLMLHHLVLERLEAWHAAWGEVAPMPPRLQVRLVRAMRPSRPPAVPQAQAGPRPPTDAEPATPTPAGALPPAVAASEVQAAASAASDAAAPLAPVAAASAASAVVADAAAPAASAASTAQAYEPGPEWPLSTRLRYSLRGNYRGVVSGHAQVEWLREGRHYQVHLAVEVGPSFAPLISRRMSSDGELTAQGIRPRRFDEDTQVLFASRARLTLHFDDEGLNLADGQRLRAPAGVQDASSQFVQLTWLMLTGRVQPRPGLQIPLPLALPRKLYAWRYEVVGLESLKTPMGELAAWHLRPLLDVDTRDLKAEVWLAPELQYLPVRLLIRQTEQTYADLMLDAVPLQSER